MLSQRCRLCSLKSETSRETNGEKSESTNQPSGVTCHIACLLFFFRLLEQQLQAWRLTVQSEQGILEDRCSEMEVTMETLRKQNVCLQGMLTQVKTVTSYHQYSFIYTVIGCS